MLTLFILGLAPLLEGDENSSEVVHIGSRKVRAISTIYKDLATVNKPVQDTDGSLSRNENLSETRLCRVPTINIATIRAVYAPYNFPLDTYSHVLGETHI